VFGVRPPSTKLVAVAGAVPIWLKLEQPLPVQRSMK